MPLSNYMKNTLLTISSLVFMGNSLIFGGVQAPHPITLAEHRISLDKRAIPGSFMNEVMRDNILLTVAYIRGMPITASPDWESVRKPFQYTFELKPGKVYTFQDNSLPEYASSVVKTTNVNFGASDGYKSDGYLMGDGVCHLASLFYWAAKDAGLEAVAPTNHNFMPIPEIPREYGVAIYSIPGEKEVNAQQNLYIRNDGVIPFQFEIIYDGKNLNVKVVKNTARTNPASITQEII